MFCDWSTMTTWGWLSMGLLWLGVAGLLVWAFLSSSVAGRSTGALETLDRRLAEGEISPEEHAHRRRVLESPR